MLRTCSKCNKQKDIGCFGLRKEKGRKIHNDERDHHAYCNPCRNDYKKMEVRRFKTECIVYKGGSCSKCDYCKCIAALEFHHIDPTQKDFMLSDVSKHSGLTDIIKRELDKCILMCANCHRELHTE